MDRLPPSQDGNLINYVYANKSRIMDKNAIFDSVLFIEGSRIDDKTIDTVQVLSGYTLLEKKEIIALTKYLKGNFLWSASYGENGGDMWCYGYRIDIGKQNFDDSRDIIALKKLSDTLNIVYGSFDKIIDRKGNLILCAFKGAKIF